MLIDKIIRLKEIHLILAEIFPILQVFGDSEKEKLTFNRKKSSDLSVWVTIFATYWEA